MATKRSISQTSPTSNQTPVAKRMEVDRSELHDMFVEFKEEILRGQSVMVSSIREEIQQVVKRETD